MRYVLLLLFPVLAACAVTPNEPSGSQPTQAPQTAAATTTSRVTLPAGSSARARSLVQVIETMEPVVERSCRRRAPNLNCDFRIVVDERTKAPPNAFQTLDENGRPVLGFTMSLLLDVRNQDELAFIFGHEAAHHIRGHLGRQQQNAMLGAVVFGALAATLGGGEASMRSAQKIGAQVGARSYSKDFELESDELGTILTLEAGYDPVRGAAYFTRIPDPGNQFLGTHPPNAARIDIVRRTAAKAGGGS